MRNCLNCKYEPNWSQWTEGGYKRYSGACKWDGQLPALPETYSIQVRHVVRYSDDSGIATKCKAWMNK